MYLLYPFRKAGDYLGDKNNKKINSSDDFDVFIKHDSEDTVILTSGDIAEKWMVWREQI